MLREDSLKKVVFEETLEGARGAMKISREQYKSVTGRGTRKKASVSLEDV